jgi:hypothetical protein
VFISDEERAIHAALMDLKLSGDYEGVHLYDSFHILHNNVFKKLRNKADIRYYSKMMHVKNQVEIARYARIAQENWIEGREQLSGTSSRIKNFTALIPWIAKVLSDLHLINESFHSLIKRFQSSEKDYVTTPRNMIDCAHRPLEKSETFQLVQFEYEKVFKVDEVKGLQLCLTKSVSSE